MEIPPLLFIVVVVIVVFLTSYRAFENDEKRRSSWRRLAAKHDFMYLPGTFLGPRGRVAGIYQGCNLALKTFRKSQGKSSRLYTSLILTKQQKSPSEAELSPEDALTWFTGLPSAAYNATLKFAHNGRELVYQTYGLESSETRLQQLFDLMSDLLYNHDSLVSLGGEAVASLERIASSRHLLRHVAASLIEQIGQQTAQQFGYQPERYLCPDCLVSYDAHTVRLSWWRSLTFYGCRQCRQSRHFLSGRVMAVLDEQMTQPWNAGEGWLVRINWLAHRRLLDFEEVHIVRAGDEDVERFAVQIGNDTDPKRRNRYAHIPCTVSADCHLSPNTLRILERTFGDVAVLETVGDTV